MQNMKNIAMHVQYSGIHLIPLIANTPFDSSFIVEYDDLRNKHGDETLQQKLKEASNYDSIIICRIFEHIHEPQELTELNNYLEEHGIKHKSVVFDNTYNESLFEKYNIKHIVAPFYLWCLLRDIGRTIPTWSPKPEYHFLCLNNFHKPHRQKVIQKLHDTKMIDKTLWSYRQAIPDAGFTTPTFIDQSTGEFDQNQNLDHLYSKCLYTIVTETDYADHKFPHATEKSLSALFYGTIPIIVGVPGTVSLLKKWGLDMFEDIVDQSYDNIPDDDARLEKIFEILERLSVGIDLDRVKNMLPLRILRNQLLLNDRNYWLNYIQSILLTKEK